MPSTKIEWCDITINPVVGCSKCSEGCRSCYAERFAARLAKNPKTAAKYAGVVDEHGKWTGKIGFADDGCFADLYNSRKSKRVFVGSMTDLFHENMPQSEVLTLVNAMSLMPNHTFMLLTKRPENAQAMLDGALGVKGFEHIWLGVTICNQAEAEEKIPVLLQTPAAKRFVSIEPMLGPVDLHGKLGHWTRPDGTGSWFSPVPGKVFRPLLDWVICGGETGSGARPMHPDWVRGLRDQCQAAGVPFFFKGWGKHKSEMNDDGAYCFSRSELHCERTSCADCKRERQQKDAGRLLDGREWNEVPV